MSERHDEHVTTGPSPAIEQGITPTRAAHHEGHPATAALPFSDADWKELRKSDIGAGGSVVVLMTVIFSIGLVLYATIALIAWS
jgi:hypothetical protein